MGVDVCLCGDEAVVLWYLVVLAYSKLYRSSTVIIPYQVPPETYLSARPDILSCYSSSHLQSVLLGFTGYLYIMYFFLRGKDR